MQAQPGRHGRQSARGHSVESPSISLCSEVDTATPYQTRENPGFADIFGKVEQVGNAEECLI